MLKDVGLRVFLKVFIDFGDEVPCGFTHTANLTVCASKFVNDDK